MISTILKGALCALKLIAFATIFYLLLCTFSFALFLFVMAHDSGLEATAEPIKTDISTPPEPKPMLALPQARTRRNNQTEAIINEILITPMPRKKKETKAKKQPSKQTKSQSKPANKPFEELTSTQLLAYAKEKKIRGYTTAYRIGKRPGLLKLIEQQPEFSQ